VFPTWEVAVVAVVVVAVQGVKMEVVGLRVEKELIERLVKKMKKMKKMLMEAEAE
jgi:hypothetical protein